MKLRTQKIPGKHILKHKTKRSILMKFLAISLVLLAYFGFATYKYGISQGFVVTALTWSFFVLCTPIADAGFLIDFPFRLIVRVRMLVSELFVWAIAICLNAYVFFASPEFYSKSKLLGFFKHILETPFPFWGIIILSLIGTFVSVQFGDELLDKFKHKHRKYYHKHKHNYRLFALACVFAITFAFYNFLVIKVGIKIPL